MIGHRTGGWIDKANQLSITRAEYRAAYGLAKSGSLRLVTFVRKELWDVREDRRALEKLLAQSHASDREFPEDVQSQLVNHSSRFVNDAEFSFSFLHEIGRIEEMKASTSGISPPPPANWIYQFSSFRDVADALKTILDLSGNLRFKTVRANLMNELANNASQFLTAVNSTVDPVTRWSRSARSSLSGELTDSTTYRETDLVSLGIFVLFYLGRAKHIPKQSLDAAIDSGEFLEFDRESGEHVIGSMQRALLSLRRELDRLMFLAEGVDRNKLAPALLGHGRGPEGLTATVVYENIKLVSVFTVHDAIDNVLVLTKAIFQSLALHVGIKDVKLTPTSPFQSDSESIKKERVTAEMAIEWLSQ